MRTMNVTEQRKYLDNVCALLTKEEERRMLILDATKRIPKRGESVTLVFNRTGTLQQKYVIDRVLGILGTTERTAYVIARLPSN